MFSRSEYATEMKLTILFLLNQARIRLTGDQIVECLAGNDIMNYFDIYQSLAGLAEAKLIYVHEQDQPVTYSSSGSGKMLLGEFKTKIPASVRDFVGEYVTANLRRLRRENEHHADYIALPDGKYNTVLQAMDDDSELIISLTAPDERTAKHLCAAWQERAGDAYALLVQTLLSDLPQED